MKRQPKVIRTSYIRPSSPNDESFAQTIDILLKFLSFTFDVSSGLVSNRFQPSSKSKISDCVVLGRRNKDTAIQNLEKKTLTRETVERPEVIKNLVKQFPPKASMSNLVKFESR